MLIDEKVIYLEGKYHIFDPKMRKNIDAIP